MRDRQSTPDTKSHHSQPTKEREAQRATAQEDVLTTQQDPLVQAISQVGSAPSAKVHAQFLSRATSDYPARGRQLMLQMQRQYGNRYVQRVMELSRQREGEAEATPEVEAAIEQARGGGRSLDTGIQRQMESAFGTSFSGVRVHTDSTADTLNQSLSARAFTTGQDIFFRQGEYNPGSSSGKELLAHELTHVVQQTGGIRSKLVVVVGQPGDEYEQEADRVAEQVMRMPEPKIQRVCPECEEELQRQTGSYTDQTGEDTERLNYRRARTPPITYQANHSIQRVPRNCDQEQIECFRRCWDEEPPWPIEKGRKGHYLYCQSKCLAEYMACIGQKAAEFAFASMAAAMQWLADHPEVVVGTIVVVAGVTFIVATGGAGGLVLVPAAASDRRLKHSIKLIDVSPQGLNIYSFKYKDVKFGKGTWQGVMSDEIPNYAVIKGNDGFDRVDYSKIDVDFIRIK